MKTENELSEKDQTSMEELVDEIAKEIENDNSQDENI